MKRFEQVTERFNLDFKNSFVKATAKERGYIFNMFDAQIIFKEYPDIFTIYLDNDGLTVAIFDRFMMRA